MRVLLVVFVAISVIIAMDPPTFIAQLMGISWGALAGAFLAPFLYGLYSKRTTAASVWVSFVFGAGIMIANMLLRSSFPTWMQSPISCGAVAMVAGLIIVPVVSVFTKKPDKELVDNAFACYDSAVTVKASKNIGE